MCWSTGPPSLHPEQAQGDVLAVALSSSGSLLAIGGECTAHVFFFFSGLFSFP